MKPHDDDLMFRLLFGDRTAFDELVRAHEAELTGFFYRRFRDRQLAEDLAQETFLRVYQAVSGYRLQNRFRGWLFSIAGNLARDTARRRSCSPIRSLTLPVTEERPDDRASDDRVAATELADLVDAALEEMPAEQCLTFSLHCLADVSLVTIADAMDVPVPTVKSRLRLAREKLRDMLAERGIVDPASRVEA